jgi:UDP-N-acetylglucosamine 2-epimerase
MKMNQANQKDPIMSIAHREESLERSMERIQRQLKIIESDGPRRHLVILLRREAWINLKRSWELFRAVRKLKAEPEIHRDADYKP